MTNSTIPFMGNLPVAYSYSKLAGFVRTLTYSEIILAVVVLLFIRRVVVAIHSLYFHPLASIPGPKLAAITRLYELYYAVFAHTKILWVEHERQLHRKYGPIIRIGPNSVHVSGIDDFREVHKAGSKFTKARYFYQNLGFDNTMLASLDHAFHRQRRGFIAPMFSKSEMLKFEGIVQARRQHLVNTMRARITRGGVDTQAVIDMNDILSAWVYDMAFEVLFHGKSNLVEDAFEGIIDPKMTALRMSVESMLLIRYLSAVMRVARALPAWLVEPIMPAGRGVANFKQAVSSIMDDIQKLRQTEKKQQDGEDIGNQKEREVVAYQLLDHLDFKTASHEATVIFSGAIHTTGWSLTRSVYFLAANRAVQEKLFAELKKAIPDRNSQISYAALESIPYMVAFMKESSRLAFSIGASNPREAPAETGAVLSGKYIPGGTIVETDSWNLHLNEEVFPDPHRFDPERWLQGEKSKQLEKHLAPFGMGSMMCVGYTLANMAMYLCVAGLVRNFELSLTEEMEKEGFEFGMPWSGIKRGLPCEFVVRAREE
ncbi:putative cytochrome P450 [Podospora australis]|uniref:Cytochrome P450 n=1 Tax=Podospora australis TaxID=1536484 RepID=A0AAN6WK31_9PEZI|nr:putative cytochrome P450 [Podospora australis]